MREYHFIGSAPPYLKCNDTVRGIMRHALIAFAPAALAAVYFFGFAAITVMMTSVLTAVATEAIIQKLRGMPITINDGSAVITGLLLSFTLPPGFPLLLTALGAVFAIAIVKHTFGGLGHNVFNPALAAWVFLAVSWPEEAAAFIWPEKLAWAAKAAGGFDAATTATPRALEKAGAIAANFNLFSGSGLISNLSMYADLFVGRVAGSLGETSALAILIGGAYLLLTCRKYVGWRVTASFIGTVAVLAWLLGGPGELATGDPIYAVLSGGVLLGAFFYATDIVTSPVTHRGQLIAGIGCGILTFVIRAYGKWPEGVVFAILIMNALTPLIDRLVLPKPLGR
ncbi:MAG: RnfABCDGE type electron transport complex subunit D [bacterium]|jgi:electron transport complex protein RnfD